MDFHTVSRNILNRVPRSPPFLSRLPSPSPQCLYLNSAHLPRFSLDLWQSKRSCFLHSVSPPHVTSTGTPVTLGGGISLPTRRPAAARGASTVHTLWPQHGSSLPHPAPAGGSIVPPGSHRERLKPRHGSSVRTDTEAARWPRLSLSLSAAPLSGRCFSPDDCGCMPAALEAALSSGSSAS